MSNNISNNLPIGGRIKERYTQEAWTEIKKDTEQVHKDTVSLLKKENVSSEEILKNREQLAQLQKVKLDNIETNYVIGVETDKLFNTQEEITMGISACAINGIFGALVPMVTDALLQKNSAPHSADGKTDKEAQDHKVSEKFKDLEKLAHVRSGSEFIERVDINDNEIKAGGLGRIMERDPFLFEGSKDRAKTAFINRLQKDRDWHIRKAEEIRLGGGPIIINGLRRADLLNRADEIQKEIDSIRNA